MKPPARRGLLVLVLAVACAAALMDSSGGFAQTPAAKQSGPLSDEEINALKMVLAKNWNTSGYKGVVTIRVRLNPDGTLAARPQVVSKSDDPNFASAAASAIQAVRLGQPYRMLKPGSHGSWKYMDIDFDPRMALNIQQQQASASVVERSYGQQLAEYVQKFKQYPATAKARHAEGQAVVKFTVNREGKIVSSDISASSGFAELDQEALAMLNRAQPFPPFSDNMPEDLQTFTLPVIFASNDTSEQEPDIDIFAFMSGKCSTLDIAGHGFACRSVAYFHTKQGRANFTIALDDPTDDSHVVSFSGENGRRDQGDLYELPIDRMLLNSKHRPKVDGLPVPFVELSAGTCKQLGNFAARQVSSISCAAMARDGKKYELKFRV